MQKKRIIATDIERMISGRGTWDSFYNKTVMVTGANGYVPSYFVHLFLALNDKYHAGITVVALCRNREKAEKKFENYLLRNDFVLLIQDVCDSIEIDIPIHYFIHAASPAGVDSRYYNPVITFQANVMGCDNLLKLAMKNPCEGFLFVSSVDVYGKVNGLDRLKESDCGILDSMNVRNVYACAKKATEMLCCSYYEKYKVPVVIVRPGQIFGPGIDLNDGRLHIDFISQILENKKIVLKSDGSARRTFLYITDAIMGMITAMADGKYGECYNVVDESGEASVLELANLMAKQICNNEIEVEFDYTKRNNIEVTSALSVVTGCSDKIKELGWKPELSLKDGAKRMMQYYGVVE